MRKTILFAVAGAGLILTGCNATGHRYQMIPVDDPSANNYPQLQQPRRPQPQPKPVVQQPVVIEDPVPVVQPVVQPVKYAPMTGVVSSGGVDSVPKKQRPPKRQQNKKEIQPAGDGKATTHIVKRGEYPGKIAKQYGVSVDALLKANNLDMASATKLQIGQKLVIPARTAVIKKDNKKVQPENPGPGKHRIQKGETPEVIARRYKVKVTELMRVNNLDEASSRRLQVGQILIIPGGGVSPAPVPVDPVNPKPVDPKPVNPKPVDPQPAPEVDVSMIQTNIFDVKNDTTYADLAKELNVSEKVLRGLNGNDQSTTIPAGSVLLIPQK